MATESPKGPLDGLGEIDGTVTSKEALAALVPSEARITCDPAGELVATNEQLKEPEPPVVQVDGDVVWATPPKVIVMVEELKKPLPVTVTEVPSGPLDGLGEIDGVDALT